jgi:ABC-type nitrate/sulfonate/bicarbonate transport system substrate-binding protein
MNRLANAGWRWLTVSLALATLTAACGSNTAPAAGPASPHSTSLNVELDWVPNPDHVGFYRDTSPGSIWW